MRFVTKAWRIAKPFITGGLRNSARFSCGVIDFKVRSEIGALSRRNFPSGACADLINVY